LDLQETWQPASPFKADLEQATLAEAIDFLTFESFDFPKTDPAMAIPERQLQS